MEEIMRPNLLRHPVEVGQFLGQFCQEAEWNKKWEELGRWNALTKLYSERNESENRSDLECRRLLPLFNSCTSRLTFRHWRKYAKKKKIGFGYWTLFVCQTEAFKCSSEYKKVKTSYICFLLLNSQRKRALLFSLTTIYWFKVAEVPSLIT